MVTKKSAFAALALLALLATYSSLFAQTPTTTSTDSIVAGATSGGVGASINQNNCWNSIAVDASGNIFAVGTTNTATAGESRIIVAKFSSTGTLSTSFNGNGVFIMNTLSTNKLDQGNGIALDSSGNVYIVGTADSGGFNAKRSDIVVAKFSSTGALYNGVAATPAWGTTGTGQGGTTGSGIVSFDSLDFSVNANGDDFGYGIAITSTGKAVVVGQSNGPFAAGGGTGGAKSDVVVFQLDTTGKLDTANFNLGALYVNGAAGGKAGALLVNANFKAAGTETATDIGMDVVLDSSGNIYALDNSTGAGVGAGIAVFKITPAGALQADPAVPAFGNFDWDSNDGGGILAEGVAHYQGNGPAQGQRIALDSTGNIYVVGTDTTSGLVGGGNPLQLLLIRFTSAGILDSTFAGGAVTLRPSIQAEGSGISIQTGGNVFVSGNSFNGTNTNFMVAEYTTTGTLLTGFASSGVSIYANPANTDVGSKDYTKTFDLGSPLVNTRTGIAAFGGTSVSAVGGVNNGAPTLVDGILLRYTLTATTGASTSAASTSTGLSSSASSSGCGALGLDAVALLGLACLLRRKCK